MRDALFSSEHLMPSIEDVSAASGISIRSSYRYFGDGHDLLRESIELLIGETRPLALFPHVGEGP